jgi:hypothetical protein
MPRLCKLDPRFDALVAAQDLVVHRDQAVAAGMTRDALAHRLETRWQPLLPSVYLTQLGEPSRRQKLIGALLYAGPLSAIDAVDACHFYGIKALRPDDELVHIVVPDTSHVRSIRWLVVRRTAGTISVVTTDRLRYVEPATAVISATRGMTSERTVVATISEAVQRGIVSIDDLVIAQDNGPRRNARPAREAIDHLRAGVRSLAEAQFRTLAEGEPSLPRLLYNPVLRLPDGTRIIPDALAPDAPLIHETNGAVAHRRQDLFEDMQRRHDLLTAAGFTVLHNAPRHIRDEGAKVIREFQVCHARLAGKGWPSGVILLDRGDFPGSMPVISR